MRVIDRIRVPALIMTAEDDPFVPRGAVPRSVSDGESEHHASWSHRTAGTARSWNTAMTDYDGYWAEREIVRFVSDQPVTRRRDAAISSFANSGPFPSSSCLK